MENNVAARVKSLLGLVFDHSDSSARRCFIVVARVLKQAREEDKCAISRRCRLARRSKGYSSGPRRPNQQPNK